MPLVIKDRVKVTSTTTGTGTYTLGSAVAGFQDFSVVGNGNTTYYCATNGTDWEVGIGTYTSSGTTLARTTILESSNSNNAVNWGAGTKDVFVTYPVEATEGTVPTADNSSVGTDLVAWTNLKKTLDAGVINGVPYNNNGTNGVVSTYSLVYTTVNAYFGGVLAPNGDIHFVPYSADRGQKVSAAGTVSTYSLVYTRSIAYQGGVLAPNGDIHFVPSIAAVGQKISSSGVVSTYSLSYTAVWAYVGGVLAPNGDIHFVPYSANRGQKISSAGVVSTYSLSYTNSGGAYSGGILAQNGDIHFVPYSANRGQKISAAGVVSTYSLVYTTATAYSGGVLAPNGDVHFVPVFGIGQKISSAGIVSTYSVVVTSGSYYGGVLAPDGSITFIPHSTNQGQKISTGVPVGIGYALNPYFNKF